VLVKILSSKSASDPDACRRFVLLARVTARLEHPNIIPIRDLGEHDGIRFIAMPALDGETLLEAMTRGLTLREGIPVILQVLDALAFMHQQGCVHGDVKPDGIFVCFEGYAVLTDLGSTALFQTISTDDTSAAASRSPPDHHSLRVDPRSDQFSVGCILYQMATGRTPFHGETPMVIFYRLMNEEPDMSLFPCGAPLEGLRTVIDRALQKAPENRYPDALTMRADLERALADLGEHA
jgi:serine/threonine-protein kinase